MDRKKISEIAKEEAQKIISPSFSKQNTVCPNLKPMTEWLKEDTKECRPCLLAPVVEWYYEELNERGYKEIATGLKEVGEKGSPEEIGAILDLIKQEVDDDVKARLEEFDCSAQVNGEF
jgi:hypothetical protein